MKKLNVVLFILISMMAFYGFSRAQKVAVLQGDFSAPYESLGIIEVNRQVPSFSFVRTCQLAGEWVTLGKYQRLPRAAYLQKLLDEELLRAAKKVHGAEMVIKAEYWPDLSSEAFPNGKMYARGEMIKYKRFPQDSVAS